MYIKARDRKIGRWDVSLNFMSLRGLGYFFLGCVPLYLALSGCATIARPASPSPHVSAVVSVQKKTLTRQEIKKAIGTAADASYVLGPDDVISVNIYRHPQLDVPSLGVTANIGGALITSGGNVQLPLIGTVHVGGLTLSQARSLITHRYAVYLVKPAVSIQLIQAQSLRYYLLGEFTDPGIKYPVRPLRLLSALALGGSVKLSSADLYQAYVSRGKIKLPVDLESLLVDGNLKDNIPLASDDTIVVPSSATEEVFVFGSVVKPGPVPFVAGRLNLLQALTSAGMDLAGLTNARLSDVRIIRPGGRTAEFIVVNARRILEGRALPFALRPGDIVFVPPTRIASWNQAIEELLPSLQGVADVLNPFVSIKYLSQ